MATNSSESVREEIEATRERIDAGLDQLEERVPPGEELKKPATMVAVGGAVAGVLGLWLRARLRDRRIRRIARQVVEEVDRERSVNTPDPASP